MRSRHTCVILPLALLLTACRWDVNNVAELPTIGPAPPSSVASVTMKYSAVDLVVGEEIQLQATPRDVAGAGTGAKTMTWSSTAPEIASVTPNALVTALAPGVASIIATADGHSGATVVTVKAKAAP